MSDPRAAAVAGLSRGSGGGRRREVVVGVGVLLVASLIGATARADFSDPVNLSAAGGDAANPEVGIDADGDALVVWERDDGNTTEIQSRAVPPTGGLGPVQTLSRPGENGGTPDVATSPDGDSIAVWQRAPAAGGPIEARTISADGVLGPVRTLSAKKAVAPQVAIDAEGDAVAVWHRDDSDADFHAVEARMISASGVLGPVRQLSAHGSRGRGAKVATDADGDSIVVWRNNFHDRIDGRMISRGGELGPVERLSRNDPRARSPDVAIDDAGNAAVVWTAFFDPDHTFVEARPISPDGFLSSIRAIADHADSPQVASEPGGGSPVVVEVSNGSGSRVAQRYMSDDGDLRPLQTLSSSGDEAVRPEVAVDADGHSIAIWQVEPNNRIEARTVGFNEAPRPIVPVVGASTPTQARVAASADGHAVAVWQRFNGADNRIQVARGPVAPPDPGALRAAGCINDIQTSGCSQEAEGLAGAASVAVSADGQSVYVAGLNDRAVVRFDRDSATGELTPAGCIDDNTGTAACGQFTPALQGVASIKVSPDGNSVYAASNVDDAVVLFDRDLNTGAITPAGCINDNNTGFDPCDDRTRGLNGANSVAVTADGRSVYVASVNDDAVTRFKRNPSTGALTPGGCVDDLSIQEPECGQSTDGLDGANSVAISPDGESVYVTSGGSAAQEDTIVRFDRNTTTGAITPAGCIADDDDAGVCAEQAPGLDGATYVTASADGSSVYVASGGLFDGDNAIVRFDRDATDGTLTPAGCVEDTNMGRDECAQSTNGLSGASSVVTSADGESVYATAWADTVVRFNRDPVSGALHPVGCIGGAGGGCTQGAPGLGGAREITLSPDDASAYVAGFDSNAIVGFRRTLPE